MQRDDVRRRASGAWIPGPWPTSRSRTLEPHAGSRARALGLGTVLLACGAGLLTGCASGKPHDGAGVTCGKTHTAAGVPVIVKIARGSVDCGTAMRVENQYAARLRSGQVAGNGGGAPITVGGWTCQGYPTPQVLSTGNASQCHTGSAMILAVLPVPAPSETA